MMFCDKVVLVCHFLYGQRSIKDCLRQLSKEPLKGRLDVSPLEFPLTKGEIPLETLAKILSARKIEFENANFSTVLIIK